MMAETAAQLASQLKELKAQRKEGQISLSSYYQQLLQMTSRLAESLGEEIENLSEEEVALQVPLVLLFVEEQIRKFVERS